MEFGILGPLVVRDEGRGLRLGGGRQRSLLAILLLRANEPVPTARLVDELWGGNAPATAAKTVQACVSGLRKTLGAGVVETRPSGYLLRVAPGALDLHEFERLLDEGRRLLRAGEAAAAGRALRDALALWRGPALGDLGDEPFAVREAARLEQLRLAALELVPPAAPELACARCGAAIQPAARFCQACGAELAVEQAIELRKTVTVLFCDVVASTELGGRLDPESLRRLMSSYFELAAEVLARHGGTVEKFVGDEVMAVFGVPAVRHDDALRAVRAAVELRERLSALVLPEWDARLEVRVGVNTGEVVAGDPGRGHGFVTGDAVNVGKRVEQAAAPGEILLGEATHALVAHAVEAEPLGRVAAKGKDDGVPMFRLRSVAADPQVLPSRPDVPLVGREQELRRLLARFALAASGEGAQLVTVVGQPGIGKSRLARELVARVSAEAATAVGRCRPYGEGVTFSPLRELLRAAGADASALDGVGHEVFTAVRATLAGLTAERPLVAVVEDVHWAEPTLLDLLEYLAARLGGARVLLVCLARPELEERRPEWLRDALVLRPLARDESEELLAELGVDPSVRKRIAETAEGNPLFAEQLAAVADEAGTLPASIRGVLAERLDRLDREERAVLERAAVAGREFSLDAVVHLSPPHLRERAPARLLALARRELVAPDASDVDAFRFAHVLIRDAAYEGMPKVLRAELHERMAERLEAEGEDAALVGHHLERAYRHRAQLGRVDGATAALGERAGHALATAGRHALDRRDLAAAAGLLDRALALLPAADPLRPALLTELGSARIKLGEFAAAETALADANEAARAAGDRRSELRALLEQQFLRSFVTPASAEVVRAAEELLPELERVDDPLGLAKAWWLRSEGDVAACRWQARADALDRALAYARAAPDVHEEASTITALLAQALYYGPTPVPAALARCEQLLQDAGGDRLLRASLQCTLAALHAMCGRSGLARGLYADAVAVYEELGLRFRRLARAAIGAHVELLAGDAAAAERELLVAYDGLSAAGEHGVRSVLGGLLAQLLCEQGRDDEAEAVAREVAADAAEVDCAPQVLWRAVTARTLARRGELEEAVGLARQAERQARATDFPELRAWAMLALAEVVGRAGDDAEAAALREAARGEYEAKGNLVAAAALAADRPLLLHGDEE